MRSLHQHLLITSTTGDTHEDENARGSRGEYVLQLLAQLCAHTDCRSIYDHLNKHAAGKLRAIAHEVMHNPDAGTPTACHPQYATLVSA